MSAAANTDMGEVLSPQQTTTALESVTRGEVDMQVATAKKWPRSITKFKQDALAMATLDVETAEACFYVLKRGGSVIEGPGVRLAEIVASCWGNLRCESRIVDEDKRFIVAQGTCWDMERNVLVRMEVRRRITGRNGETFSDDMIGVTGNAASAIAFRNAVFKVIPNAFTRAIYEEARRTAVGDSRTLEQRRQIALTWFSKAGVSQERVLAMLGKQGVEDIDIAALTILSGTRTAIQEGTTTIDEAFPATDLKPGTHSFGFKKDEPTQTDAERAVATRNAAYKANDLIPPEARAEAAKETQEKTAPPAETKTEEKPKRQQRKDAPKSATVASSALESFLADVAKAETDEQLTELFKKTGSMAPGDIQAARKAVNDRRVEIEFQEPPHDPETGVVTDTRLPAGSDE